jgi:hypothetical protein
MSVTVFATQQSLLTSHCTPTQVSGSAWEQYVLGSLPRCMSQNNILVTGFVHARLGRRGVPPDEAVRVSNTLLTIDFHSSHQPRF